MPGLGQAAPSLGPELARLFGQPPALLEPALLEPALLEPALLEPALLEPALLEPALLEPALPALAAPAPASVCPALSIDLPSPCALPPHATARNSHETQL